MDKNREESLPTLHVGTYELTIPAWVVQEICDADAETEEGLNNIAAHALEKWANQRRRARGEDPIEEHFSKNASTESRISMQSEAKALLEKNAPSCPIASMTLRMMERDKWVDWELDFLVFIETIIEDRKRLTRELIEEKSLNPIFGGTYAPKP